jgi:hypothetical protein
MTNSPRNRRASDGHLVASSGPDLDIVRTALHGIRRDIELFDRLCKMTERMDEAEVWNVLDRIRLRERDALKQLGEEAR